MLLMSLLACSANKADTADPSEHPLLGRWAGNCDVHLDGGSAMSLVDLTLESESDGVLTGTGSVSDYDTVSGPVTARETDDDVEITVTATDGDETYTILGVWDGADRIEGSCGSDYQDGSILLTR